MLSNHPILMRVMCPVGFAILLFVTALPASAGVKPGDFITPDNASKVKAIVSPGTYYKLMNGMTMKIIASGRIDWPPPYKEATEKYSAQVRLSPNHRSLIGTLPVSHFR